MTIEELIHRRDELRQAWRSAREKKLIRQRELLSAGEDASVIRKDKAYKAARKEQHHLSRMIVHVERKINRKKSHEQKKEE